MKHRIFDSICAVLFAATLALVSGAGWAQPKDASRLALVIGNAAYAKAPLNNTLNDARDMAELLRRAGFEVDLRLDASNEDFREAIASFGKRIDGTSVKTGVFYYAGHAFQLNLRNYLVPTNARIRGVDDVPSQAVDVTDLLRYMERRRDKSLLVILDSCRDDPFLGPDQSGVRGLSPYNAPVGTLLAYATGPGQTAQDGEGRNGLYTKYLLKELTAPGETLMDGFMRVRVGVMTESHGKQIPWELSSLIDRELYLFPVTRKKLEPAEVIKRDDQEIQAWRQTRSGTDKQAPVAEDIARFLKSFPNGVATEQAQFLLRRLLAQQAQQEARAQAIREAHDRAEQAKQAAAQLRNERLQEQRLAAQKARDAKAEREQAAKLEAERLAAARRDLAAKQAAKPTKALSDEQHELEAQLLAMAQAKTSKTSTAPKAVTVPAPELEARLEALAQASEQEIVQQEVKLAAAKSEEEFVVPIHIAPSVNFQGYDEHVRRYSVGDEYAFQVIDGFNGKKTPLEMRVTAVDVGRDRVEYNGGDYVSDLMGNVQRNARGDFDVVRQFYPANLVVGKQWRTHFRQSRPDGKVYTFRYDLHVVGREKITVPAGTFDTYKIEARGFNMELGASLERNIWVAPGISADIVHETLVRLRGRAIDQFERQELVRYVKR